MKRIILILLVVFSAVAVTAQNEFSPDRKTFYKDEGMCGRTFFLDGARVRVVETRSESDIDVYVSATGGACQRPRLNVIIGETRETGCARWQFVTKPGDEDFTVRFVPYVESDIVVCFVNPQEANKYIRDKHHH